MYIKSTVILLGLATSFCATFFGNLGLTVCIYFCWWHIPLGAAFCLWIFWLQVSALFAVLLGVCMAEVGVSIQHDANHGAYSKNSWLEYTLGTTLDVIGASSFMWKQQHVIGHHTYTNVEGLDPDIRVKDPDVRRVSQHQPWQSYQACHSTGSDIPVSAQCWA